MDRIPFSTAPAIAPHMTRLSISTHERRPILTPDFTPTQFQRIHPMNENELTKPRPFRRCLATWPEGMGVEDVVVPISIPDAWLTTTQEFPYPWNGAFLKWQEEFKRRPR